jgi:hypothetical protein
VASSSQMSPLVEKEAPISKHVKDWREQKYGHWYRREMKPRMTVLPGVSSNLPDRPRDQSLEC